MAEYSAPLRDMQFVIKELGGLDAIGMVPEWEEITPDLVDALLEQAGRFATGVLSPLNWAGDRNGCKLEDGVVITPPVGIQWQTGTKYPLEAKVVDNTLLPSVQLTGELKPTNP